MFRQLAANLAAPGDVFQAHSSDLSQYLETVWASRSPVFVNNRPGFPRPEPYMNSLRFPFPVANQPTVWHNLSYAYLIECTNIVEIFERVMYEYLNGERLGIFSPASQLWLRNTEDLFYKDPPPFSIYSVRSDLRPDYNSVRRNAYYRMYGWELPHESSSGSEFVKAEASNIEFATILEEFLHETWVGIENVDNISGTNPTDDQAIANLARRMSIMIQDRRHFGTLSREEFFAVAKLSWYHLTVEFNSPIIIDLRAQGTSSEERIRKVGEKVSMNAHAKADSYFEIAEPMSFVLNALETQALNNANTVGALYANGTNLRNWMEMVITHWSMITGRNMKAKRVLTQ